MCEYCLKRVCPNGCPNNYIPRGRKRGEENKNRRIEFKTVAIYGNGHNYIPNSMNVPLTNKELTMKS